MKAKSKYIIVLALVLFVACAILGISLTLSWLGGSNEMNPSMKSTVITQYFESGTGTEKDPFIIHTPRQLYNLAWLQYMGEFNTPVNGVYKQYWFELCDGTNTWASGHSDSGISGRSLDMTGWTLPPIGTAQYPFIGHFEGNGIAISNLNITSDYSKLNDQALDGTDFAEAAYTASNRACDIVGLFGVVGSIDNTAGTLSGATYTSSVNTVQNLYVNNVTVETQTTTSLIGIVAGYVNGTIDNVGVVSSSITVGNTGALNNTAVTGKISNYALVGYCTDAFKGIAGVAERTVDGPNEDAEYQDLTSDSIAGIGDAWGGSVDMQTMYTKLSTIQNNAVRQPVANETVTVTTTGNTTTVTSVFTRGAGNLGTQNGSNVVNYYGDNGGVSGTFVRRTDTNDYIYLTEATAKKTQTTTNYTYTDDGSFYITSLNNDSTNTLTYNSSLVLTNTSSSDENPIEKKAWYFDNGAIYTTVDGVDYYLNRSSGTAIALSTVQTTIWTKGANRISCVVDGTQKYLCYLDGAWKLSDDITCYVITDGQGNYLKISGSSFENTTNSAQAAQWNSNSGKLQINGVSQYLHYNNGLTITTDGAGAITWINDGASIYCVVDGVPRYITYNDGVWKATNPPDPVREIHSGSNFLCVNNSGNLTNGSSGTTQWTFHAVTAGHYQVFTTVNGTRYYLTPSAGITEGNTGTVSTSTSESPFEWIWDPDQSDSLYYSENNNDNAPFKFLIYSSGWKITVPTVYYTISDEGGNNYLRNNSGSIANSTTQSETNGTWWTFSDKTNINEPQGKIYNNGRYLRITESGSFFNKTTKLTLTSNSNDDATTWEYNNSRLRIFISGSGCDSNVYLKYNNGWDAKTGTQTLRISPVQHKETLSFESVQTAPPEAYFAEERSIPLLQFPAAASQQSTGTVTDNNALAATTYFPLNSVDGLPFTAVPANTGYVISGANEPTSYKADIRVSRYGINNIRASTGGTYSADTVRIVTCNSNGDFRYISDPEENATVSNAVGTVNTAASVNELGLQKFRSSKEQLNELLSGSTYIYGLHFMNAQISSSNKIKATKAVINGKTYANYELPRDCIDCNLRTQGYINFFAGTYYSSSVNTFFSLHKIERNSNNTISSIKQIDKIYKPSGNGSGDYVYQYVGESAPSSHGDLIFDMSWVTNVETVQNDDEGTRTQQRTTLVQNALYYFEIPVNRGEYALGSVSGQTGAYLIYLDISANSVFYKQKTTTTVDTISAAAYEYPKGVDIVQSISSPIGVTPSAVVSIKNGSRGTVTLARTGSHEVTYSLGQGASFTDISSTYTACLNTDPASGVDIAIDSVRSVYGDKSDLTELDLEGLGSLTKITAQNQYIDADVILTNGSSALSAEPLATITQVTTTTFYRYYYSYDGVEYIFAGSTEDNPTRTIVSTETGPNNIYDLASASLQMDMVVEQPVLRSAPRRASLERNSVSSVSNVEPVSVTWVSSAPPEDEDVESLPYVTADIPFVEIDPAILEEERLSFKKQYLMGLSLVSDEDLVTALEDNGMVECLMSLREDETVIQQSFERFTSISNERLFRQAWRRLNEIYSDDAEILEMLSGAVPDGEKADQFAKSAFFDCYLLAPDDGECVVLPVIDAYTQINATFYSKPAQLNPGSVIDGFSWGNALPKGIIALVIPADAVGSMTIKNSGVLTPVFLRADGSSVQIAEGISINLSMLESSSWCAVDENGAVFTDLSATTPVSDELEDDPADGSKEEALIVPTAYVLLIASEDQSEVSAENAVITGIELVYESAGNIELLYGEEPIERISYFTGVGDEMMMVLNTEGNYSFEAVTMTSPEEPDPFLEPEDPEVPEPSEEPDPLDGPEPPENSDSSEESENSSASEPISEDDSPEE